MSYESVLTIGHSAPRRLLKEGRGSAVQGERGEVETCGVRGSGGVYCIAVKASPPTIAHVFSTLRLLRSYFQWISVAVEISASISTTGCDRVVTVRRCGDYCPSIGTDTFMHSQWPFRLLCSSLISTLWFVRKWYCLKGCWRWNPS